MSEPRSASDIEEIIRRDVGELRALIKGFRTKQAIDKLDAIEMKLRNVSKTLKG